MYLIQLNDTKESVSYYEHNAIYNVHFDLINYFSWLYKTSAYRNVQHDEESLIPEFNRLL